MYDWIKKYGETLITVATVIGGVAAVVTIFDQRLGAQDRLIAQRFEAVDQRFEAQYRLIDQRFEAQDNLIAQRFEAVDQRFEAIDHRFDAVDRRFNDMNKRIDRLADEVSELRTLTVGISERVSRNEGRIDVILEQMRAEDTPSP